MNEEINYPQAEDIPIFDGDPETFLEDGISGFRHYIAVDAKGRITDGWSDGPHPEKNVEGAVCIREKGGYQFCLDPDGEENPPLYDMDGIPLYRWDGENAILRTQEELEAERANLPQPGPSTEEQLRADVDFIAAMVGITL